VFETVELGRRISKADFAEEETHLRYDLLQAQFALQRTDIPVLVVIAGVEGAGKGEVANRLSEWLDVRGTAVHAFRAKTDEEELRPRMWRYWQSLPARGEIGVYVRSWYSRPILDHATGLVDDDGFARQLARIARFEEMLASDDALIVKLWLHIPKKVQSKRFDKLRKKASTRYRVSPEDLERNRSYRKFSTSAELAIRQTDLAHARWTLVEATQKRYRDLEVGRVLLREMRNALRHDEARKTAPPRPSIGADLGPAPHASGERSVLDSVNLSRSVPAAEYKPALDDLQEEVGRLGWLASAHARSTVVVFEGWDAAGKGGAIRRLTRALDARLYKVHSIAAPSEEERAHHYLWRFWRHVPRAGHFTIYDRSWYGRVLVERVEGFASETEWRRAYREINDFEEQLVEGGVSLVKIFLHIDPDEQLRRFEERQSVAYKRHKITEEDWRNREKWGAYRAAIDDMVARTSSAVAPWTLVPANDKRSARLDVLRAVRDRLRTDLRDA
jgi:polyphosphate:AMP phosphotransferase